MFKIEGLEEFPKDLDNFSEKLQELDGEHEIPVSELLTDSFLSQDTKFSCVEEMFNATGFKIESREDFAAIPGDVWDNFICSISGFDSWQSMFGAAGEEWVAKKLASDKCFGSYVAPTKGKTT